MRSERSQYIFPLTDTLGVAQAEWPSAELLQVALFNPFVMPTQRRPSPVGAALGCGLIGRSWSWEEDRVEGGGVVKTLVKAGESFARTLILLMIASCTAVGIH